MLPTSRLSARRGFTFLEIMFVVVIIGVLMAIAVPRMTGQAQKARIQATEVTMRTLQTALAQYEMHVGSFPNTNEGLNALLERPGRVSETAWDGPYLESDTVPRDAWGNAFNYRSPGQNRPTYDLWSNGPDGMEGTDDDIRNWTRRQ